MEETGVQRVQAEASLYRLSNVKELGCKALAPHAQSLVFQLLLGRTSQWKRESCTACVELWNNLAVAVRGLREQHQCQKHHAASVSAAVSGWQQQSPCLLAEQSWAWHILTFFQNDILFCWGHCLEVTMGLVVQRRIQGNERKGLQPCQTLPYASLGQKYCAVFKQRWEVRDTFCTIHLNFTPIVTSMYKYATFMGKVICWLPLVEPECYVCYF